MHFPHFFIPFQSFFSPTCYLAIFLPPGQTEKYTPLLLLNKFEKRQKLRYNRFKYFLKQTNNYNDHSKFRAYQVQICQNKKLIDDDDNVNDDD